MTIISLTIYLLIVVISVLLFGAVHTYAYTIMTLGVLLASVLLLVKSIRKSVKYRSYYVQLPNTSANLALFLFLGLLVLQVIDLPEGAVAFLSPEAQIVGEGAVPASVVAASTVPSQCGSALAPYTYPVRMSMLRFIVYGLFFLGLTQVLTSQKRIELVIAVILAVGCFEALYGLIQTFSESGQILWFGKTSYRRDITGTYINRNHFAGLMGMGLLLAAAYATALGTRKKKEIPATGGRKGFRARVSQFVLGEQRLNKRALILFSGVVMGIGLIFSASRGGMLAAAGGLLCMAILFLWRKTHRTKGLVLLILFVITTVYALQIGVEYPLGRFQFFWRSFEERSQLAEKTMTLFSDYRLAGVGVGNFQYAYPKYQPAERKGEFVRHAHNDWAQFLAEAGILGLGLLLAGVGIYLFRTLRLWKKRSDPFAVCLGLAPLAVMAAVAIHAVSDFNLHVPANFLMLTAVTAVGYSALHLERHRGGDKVFLRYHVLPLRYRGLAALLVVLGFMCWSGIWTVRHFVAEAYCNTVHNSTLNRDQNPPLEEIQKAIAWDPANAGYWFKMGREMIRLRDIGGWTHVEGQGRAQSDAGRSDGRIEGLRDLGIEGLRGWNGGREVERSAMMEYWNVGMLGLRSTDNGERTTTIPIAPVLQYSTTPARGTQQTADNGEWSRASHEATQGYATGDVSRRLTPDRRQPAQQGAGVEPSVALQKQIVAALEQAAQLNPFNAEYHLRLAWEYSRLWDDSDQCRRWQAAADLSAQRAAYFAGEKNPLHHLNIANYWVRRSKTMAPADPAWSMAWERASWHFKRHEALEKG